MGEQIWDRGWCAILGAGMVSLVQESNWVWFAIWSFVLLLIIFKNK